MGFKLIITSIVIYELVLDGLGERKLGDLLELLM